MWLRTQSGSFVNLENLSALKLLAKKISGFDGLSKEAKEFTLAEVASEAVASSLFEEICSNIARGTPALNVPAWIKDAEEKAKRSEEIRVAAVKRAADQKAKSEQKLAKEE